MERMLFIPWKSILDSIFWGKKIKEKIGKKGVVKDKKVHEEVISSVISFATAIGLEIIGLEYSPIKGPEGNIEYLLYAKKCKEQEMRQKSLQKMLAFIPKLVNKAHSSLD